MNFSPTIHWSKIQGWLRLAALFFGVLFLARQLFLHWAGISLILQRLQWEWLLASIVLATISNFLSMFPWRILLRHNGIHLSMRAAWKYHIQGMLVRYIPGMLPGLLGRLDASHRAGVTIVHGSVLYIQESLISLLVASLVAFGAAVVTGSPLIIMASLAIFIASAVGLVMPQPLPKIVHALHLSRFFSPTPIQLIWLAGRPMILGWLFTGLSLASAVMALNIGMHNNPLFYVSAAAASWMAGFIVFFAPAGLGIREGALIFFLAPGLGAAGAVLTSLLSRTTLIVGEAVSFFITLPIRQKKRDHLQR